MQHGHPRHPEIHYHLFLNFGYLTPLRLPVVPLQPSFVPWLKSLLTPLPMSPGSHRQECFVVTPVDMLATYRLGCGNVGIPVGVNRERGGL